ncbi:MAG: hypothetical protein ACR5K2_05430 [Wolbachia sp.]
MAAGGKAKTASKNNPTQRKKAEQKMYKDKPVKPVRYIDRDCCDILSASYSFKTTAPLRKRKTKKRHDQ